MPVFSGKQKIRTWTINEVGHSTAIGGQYIGIVTDGRGKSVNVGREGSIYAEGAIELKLGISHKLELRPSASEFTGRKAEVGSNGLPLNSIDCPMPPASPPTARPR